MASFTAEDILTESVKTLMEDEVCIDTAMKNVIAKVYALYSTQDRNTSFSRNDNSQVVYKDIMSCARFILQAFNNHTLRSYEEWTEDNPQREDTSADSRLKELTNYKAAHYLKSKLEGEKLSKSLGRRYLLATGLWHSYVLPAAQEKSTSSGVEQDVFTYFSTEFGLSLQDDYIDADLVWAKDFNKTLQQKQLKRAKGLEENYHDQVIEKVEEVVDEIPSKDSS